VLSGDVFEIQQQRVQRSDEVPSNKLISQILSYATELERIV
jgi:hypothetical protein